jgi:hypothetical protein
MSPPTKGTPSNTGGLDPLKVLLSRRTTSSATSPRTAVPATIKGVLLVTASSIASSAMTGAGC